MQLDGLCDLAEIRGHHMGRRALEVAAAGGHHLLLVGGKDASALARLMPSILPPLSFDDALDRANRHALAGLPGYSDDGPFRAPPFRAPDRVITDAMLVGGQGIPVAEVALAHNGVLFLEGLGDFRGSALHSLRDALDAGLAAISDAYGPTNIEARPLVVASMNPCPCGHYASASGKCRCSLGDVRAYRAPVSVVLQRFDVQVSLPPQKYAAEGGIDESSASVGVRVERARQLQRHRAAKGVTSAGLNAGLTVDELERVARLPTDATSLMVNAALKYGMSFASHHAILRVARTIADLCGAVDVGRTHIAEAIQLRLPG